MAKKWQQKDITSLKRSASTKSVEELAELFGTDVETIESKLQELGLGEDASRATAWYEDPLVGKYEAAVQLLQKGNWKKAHGAFTQILEEVDIPELGARTRQMQRICALKLEDQNAASEDPYLEAVYRKNRGDYQRALEICAEGDRLAKEDRYAYLAASVHALSEQTDEAVASLLKAVELNPKNRVYAYHDPDLESLIGRPELEQLFGAS